MYLCPRWLCARTCSTWAGWFQWPGRFWGIIGQVPSVSKSNRLHVVIFRFFFINLRYILWIPLKWWVIFLKSWTSTDYFSNSTGSSVTSGRFSPFIGLFTCGRRLLWRITYGIVLNNATVHDTIHKIPLLSAETWFFYMQDSMWGCAILLRF